MTPDNAPDPQPSESKRSLASRLPWSLVAGAVAAVVAWIVVSVAGRWLGYLFDYFDTTRERYVNVVDWAALVAAGLGGLWIVFAFAHDRRQPRETARPISSAESDEPSQSWASFWFGRANTAAAVGVVVAAVFGLGHLYVGFLKHALFAPLVVFLGLPFILLAAYVAHEEHREITATWAGCAAVLILFAAVAAMRDAHQLHYANCWRISGDTASSVWECAPGRSEPDQWSYNYDPNTDTETPGNSCEYLRTSSSGGTIWHCAQT